MSENNRTNIFIVYIAMIELYELICMYNINSLLISMAQGVLYIEIETANFFSVESKQKKVKLHNIF